MISSFNECKMPVAYASGLRRLERSDITPLEAAVRAEPDRDSVEEERRRRTLAQRAVEALICQRAALRFQDYSPRRNADADSH
jgi:hypothetical protein